MSNIDEGIKSDAGRWYKKRFISLITLVLVVALTIVLFIFSLRNPQKLSQLGNYSYLGIFLFCLVSNATVILPVPGILVALPLVTSFNPVIIGLVGAAGGSIGELTGYLTGYSGWTVIKRNPMHGKVEGWMKKWGGWVIFFFAASPYLPVDVAGIVAGTMRYPIWKFWLFCWIGKSIKYVTLALAFAWGLNTILHFFGS